MNLSIHHAMHLRDAPPAVISLAYLAKAELQRHRNFPVRFLDGNEITIWAQNVSGNAVGIACTHRMPDGKTWWSDLIYVTQEYRRFGAAKMLMDRHSELSKADPHCTAVEWCIRMDNVAMQRLEEQLGNHPVSLNYRKEIKK